MQPCQRRKTPGIFESAESSGDLKGGGNQPVVFERRPDEKIMIKHVLNENFLYLRRKNGKHGSLTLAIVHALD